MVFISNIAFSVERSHKARILFFESTTNSCDNIRSLLKISFWIYSTKGPICSLSFFVVEFNRSSTSLSFLWSAVTVPSKLKTIGSARIPLSIFPMKSNFLLFSSKKGNEFCLSTSNIEFIKCSIVIPVKLVGNFSIPFASISKDLITLLWHSIYGLSVSIRLKFGCEDNKLAGII